MNITLNVMSIQESYGSDSARYVMRIQELIILEKRIIQQLIHSKTRGGVK